MISHLRALFFPDYADVPHNPVNAAFYLATSQGHNAVMVFFVLSGYWVGGAVIRQVRRGDFTWRRHASQRLTRLWLVLLPALALTAAADTLGRYLRPGSDLYAGVPAYHDVAPMDPAAHAGWDVLLGNVVFVQSIKVPTFGTNGPLWSLAYEFAYYALFPLAVLVVARRTSWARRLVCGVLLIAGALFVGENVLVLGVVWLLGAGLAWQAPALRSLVERAWLGLAQVLAALALGAGLAAATRVGAGHVADVLVVIPSVFLLVTLLPDVRGPRRLTGAVRAYSQLAHSSYSLYAIHSPLLVLAAALIVPLTSDRWAPGPASYLAFGGLYTLTLIAGHLFALATERNTDRVRAVLLSAGGRRSRRREPVIPGAPSSA